VIKHTKCKAIFPDILRFHFSVFLAWKQENNVLFRLILLIITIMITLIMIIIIITIIIIIIIIVITNIIIVMISKETKF